MPKKPKKEKKTLEEVLKKKIVQLSALYEVAKSITSTLYLEEVLKLITRKTTKIMDGSSCTLRLLDPAGQELVLKCSYGLGQHICKVKKPVKIGEGIVGSVARSGRPCIINDIRQAKRYKYPNIAKQKGLLSFVAVPLVQRNKPIGVLSVYSKKINRYSEDDARLLSMFASQAAIAIENATLYERAEVSYLNTIKTLSNIIDAKDSHTYGHSERVMEQCIVVADAMGMVDRDKETLKYASLLHDIGKIGIDVGILRKPSKLSEEEWKIMVMHPVLGSGIVEQIGFLSELAPLILRHHERYDGRGYPGRLKKTQIPLGARILSVADAYESMVSDRPYRKGMSSAKATQEIIRCSGKQFDPKIVKIFLSTLRKKKKRRR